MAAVTTSACTNPAASTLLGFGAPIGFGFDSTAMTATATTTIAITGCPGITKGKIRIQCTNPNAATTFAVGLITATDGTTTVQVGGTTTFAATAAGTKFDFIKEFVLPISANSFSIVFTLAGSTTTGTVNTEIYGNP